jgi:hypothetical protein
LKPSELQPSGSLNFSRLDSFKINFKFNPKYLAKLFELGLNMEISVYGITYNILRIMSGMAGLAFENF